MCRQVCTLTDWQLLTLTLTLTAAAVLEAAGCTALLVALTLVPRGCRSLLIGSVAVAVAAVAVLAVVVVECLMLALMQMRRLTFMSTLQGPLEVSYFILLFK
jgi:hypothetical protein